MAVFAMNILQGAFKLQQMITRTCYFHFYRLKEMNILHHSMRGLYSVFFLYLSYLNLILSRPLVSLFLSNLLSPSHSISVHVLLPSLSAVKSPLLKNVQVWLDYLTLKLINSKFKMCLLDIGRRRSRLILAQTSWTEVVDLVVVVFLSYFFFFCYFFFSGGGGIMKGLTIFT